VTCHPVDDKDDNISDPVLVLEVISPSTEREDRGRKKFDYFATPRFSNTQSSNRTRAESIFTVEQARDGPMKLSRAKMS
jgi:Putative restriction endonuclease